VLAGRLGERKRDNSNSASLEVGGAKKLQFFVLVVLKNMKKFNFLKSRLKSRLNKQ
jgi:hypothetical protein